ncbi:MAG: LLM class flavin-dependent oxidoreductase, partial [Gemmatimonadetes bacterium]|nr:LLM class flavin-dependent oxidoreductase [Gemmatimonadota bacterium]
LGSSQESAMLAARLGLPYNFALFINSNIDPRILEFYRHYFEPSTQTPQPEACIAINVICADTEAEAQRLSLSRDLLFARFASGKPSYVVPTVEEAEKHRFSEAETAFLEDKFRLAAVGSPDQVRDTIDRLAGQFGAEEVMAVTITHDFKARLRSYELLADVYR